MNVFLGSQVHKTEFSLVEITLAYFIIHIHIYYINYPQSLEYLGCVSSSSELGVLIPTVELAPLHM